MDTNLKKILKDVYRIFGKNNISVEKLDGTNPVVSKCLKKYMKGDYLVSFLSKDDVIVGVMNMSNGLRGSIDGLDLRVFITFPNTEIIDIDDIDDEYFANIPNDIDNMYLILDIEVGMNNTNIYSYLHNVAELVTGSIPNYKKGSSITSLF